MGLTLSQVYSISDVIRASQHTVVIAGNPLRSAIANPLLEWGERVWTFPEILLSRGNAVTVFMHSKSGTSIKRYSKNLFPLQGWNDPHHSRQLLDHFTNLHLSRLEMIKIALECLMNRKFKAKHPGDRSYALMGLLRIRPPIDRNDSSFQAFARYVCSVE
jgi:hypothetical protein